MGRPSCHWSFYRISSETQHSCSLNECASACSGKLNLTKLIQPLVAQDSIWGGWVVGISWFIRILPLSSSDQVSSGGSWSGERLGYHPSIVSMLLSVFALFPVGFTDSKLSDLPIQAMLLLPLQPGPSRCLASLGSWCLEVLSMSFSGPHISGPYIYISNLYI